MTVTSERSDGTTDPDESIKSMPIIDCDVHQDWRSEGEIVKRLPPHFRHRGVYTPTSHWKSPIGFLRDDAVPEEGGRPGSSPAMMQDQLLDEFDINHAVLTGPGEAIALGTMPNADYAIALARAYNDWLRETWLEEDERFLGSIAVPPQCPNRAAEEIRRNGDDDRMVQVIMPSATRIPYGQRNYWPIYEAAEEMGLPVALHVGPEGWGFTNPPTSAGYPSTYFERHTVHPANYMGQLASIILEGVFEEFPDLKFAFVEGGIGWVPHLMWRMDKNWKALRDQTPWLKRPPSEYVIEHCRFTTQPIEEPEKPEHLRQIFEMVHAEKTVMFCSDYPHWDNDSPTHGLPPMSDKLERRIFYETARELYGL